MNFLVDPIMQGSAEQEGIVCSVLSSCGIYIGPCESLDPGNCTIWVKSFNL